MSVFGKPFLFNISGPYAVGKDTIINQILSTYPTKVFRVNTLTTRSVSRDVDPSYKHVDIEELKLLTSKGHWIVNFQLSGSVAYATSLDEIVDKAKSGLICVHSIFAGPEGAGKLREFFGKNVFSIGLLASRGGLNKQLDILRNRLINRGRDSEVAIEARLKYQIEPLEYVIKNPYIKTPNGLQKVFDEIIINKDLDNTIQHVLSLFQRIFLEDHQ